MTKEKIFIQIDDERIEATGEVLENLLADIADNKAKEAAAEAAAIQKAEAKAAVAERLGLTVEELAALLG